MDQKMDRHSVVATLVEAPWWMTLLLGAACCFMLQVIVPGVLDLLVRIRVVGHGGTMLAHLSQAMALAGVVLFLGLAVLSYRHARAQRERVAQWNKLAGLRRQRPGAASPPASAGPFAATLATVPPGAARQAMAPALAPAAPAAPAAPPASHGVREWSVQALKQLEWKRFEQLCVAYYEVMGFRVKSVPHGPDGGIDATLYKRGQRTPLALVQCKAWQRPVKVEPVRALAGVMLEQQVRRGVFWSMSGYVGQPVRDAAARAGIQLLDGEAIVARLRALPEAGQAALLALAFDGDYRTPTCVACGVKLVARRGKAGPLWGCVNFPRCRVMLPRAA